jgi:hypothetical protein
LKCLCFDLFYFVVIQIPVRKPITKDDESRVFIALHGPANVVYIYCCFLHILPYKVILTDFDYTVYVFCISGFQRIWKLFICLFVCFLIVCLFVFVLFFKKHFDFELQMEYIPQESHAHYTDIYVFITLFRKCKFQQ